MAYYSVMTYTFFEADFSFYDFYEKKQHPHNCSKNYF